MIAPIHYILSLSPLQLIYHTLGCFYLVQLARLMISVIWNIFKEIMPLNNLLKKYSQSSQASGQCWAVITGGTDGIGLGFAQVLTQLGFNICLISRSQQKLYKTVEALKKYRSQQYKQRKFMTIQFDYSQSSNKPKFRHMIQKVKQLDIGILVNNVGTSELKEYENFSYEDINKIINVNCTSMSVMTSQLLKQLKQRKSKSAIINLSSFAGQNPQPYICLYSATKAMNTFFSEALSLQNPQIDILSVRPMYVESPLSRKKKGFNIPDRRECAYACLKELRWQYQTNGYVLHRISAKIHQLFVPKFVHRILTKILIRAKIAQFENYPGN